MTNNSNNSDIAIAQLTNELLEFKHANAELQAKLEAAQSGLVAALEQQKRNEFLFQYSQLNYFSLNSEFILTSANPACIRALGYSSEEILGHAASHFISEKSASVFSKPGPDFAKQELLEYLEVEIKRNDGTLVSAIAEAKTVFDSEGKFSEMHCIWTEKEKSQQDEKESITGKNSDFQDRETWFSDLFELAVDGILIGSAEGNIIRANTYMLNLTGRSVQNLVGKNITELFSPNVLNDVPLRYDLLKKGETVFSERDILRPDGVVVPVEMHTKMMPDGTYQSIYRNISDRRKSEEILRQSEEKYRALVESTTDIIWETNEDGFYTYVSPQFKSILGYTPQETIGKSPYDFISDDQLSKLNSRDDSTDDSELPFYLLVNTFKHRNGKLVYFETSGLPVYDKAGNRKGYRGMSRDITKRQLAEKEVYKLSLVVNQSPNTILITDLEGRIEYINPSGCAISGYELSELLGKSPSIFSAGETPNETYVKLWETITNGNEWNGSFLNKRKNGEYFWESATVVPIKDTEGNITNYLGIKQDISDRIHAEVALKESEKRYRELFESSPDAIMLADIETGMLVDANNAACVMLGLPLDEIKKLHQSSIHPAHIGKHVRELFISHVQRDRFHKPLTPTESIVVRSDGTEIAVEILSDMITIQGKSILQGVFRNITERKQAQEELLKAKEKAEAGDRVKSAFINNISHELRTPLNGIIGFSEMIAQMGRTEEDRQEFSRMIKKSSTRLINTITSYIDISMIVTGNIEVNILPFSLNRMLEGIYVQTQEICAMRGLSLDIVKDFPESDVIVISDEDLLNKIFTHLIDNAIKFTQEGSIRIGYDHIDGLHRFSVIDTGRGISQESLPAIFDIFMQADLSTSRGYEGSGLGLSIARGFVKELGGEIWVESKNHEGSSFYFTIPENLEIAISPAKTEQKSAAGLSSQPVILVAEDDDSNFKYLEIILKKASYKVLRSSNGFETVDMCRTNPGISILLTDLKMPGMSGVEATRKIKKMLPALPVIMLSAFASPDDEDLALAAGCNAYIVKPVNRLKLLDTIAELLRTAKS